MPDDFDKSDLQNIANHPVIQHLRQRGPLTVEELPQYRTSEGLESSVGGLELTERTMREYGLKTIYYLYGDERRAVQKFIKENEEFVKSCIRGDNEAINAELEDFWWQIFREEWVWTEHEEN